MTATMAIGEHLATGTDGGFEAKRLTPGSRWVLPSIISGLVLIACSAGIALAATPTPTTPARRVAPVGGVPAVPSPSITTASITYPPGHSSGWHVHPGVHSVVVLAGTLTMYDEHCVRTDYGPGETYLGGNAPHLARNEGTDDVSAAVTYVYRVPGEGHGSAVADPADCDVR